MVATVCPMLRARGRRRLLRRQVQLNGKRHLARFPRPRTPAPSCPRACQASHSRTSRTRPMSKRQTGTPSRSLASCTPSRMCRGPCTMSRWALQLTRGLVADGRPSPSSFPFRGRLQPAGRSADTTGFSVSLTPSTCLPGDHAQTTLTPTTGKWRRCSALRDSGSVSRSWPGPWETGRAKRHST